MGPPEPRCRYPSTQCHTQREPRSYKTPHDHSTNPVSTLGNSHIPKPPTLNKGLPTLALDGNGKQDQPRLSGAT